MPKPSRSASRIRRFPHSIELFAAEQLVDTLKLLVGEEVHHQPSPVPPPQKLHLSPEPLAEPLLQVGRVGGRCRRRRQSPLLLVTASFPARLSPDELLSLTHG